MNETDEQIERLYQMPEWERHSRTIRGLDGLKGYAEWKAGMIIAFNVVFSVFIVALISYVIAFIVFIPVSFFSGYEASFSLSNSGDIAFHVVAVAIFSWLMPSQALNTYRRLRDELEKVTREEGTFWHR